MPYAKGPWCSGITYTDFLQVACASHMPILIMV